MDLRHQSNARPSVESMPVVGPFRRSWPCCRAPIRWGLSHRESPNPGAGANDGSAGMSSVKSDVVGGAPVMAQLGR